MMSLVFKPQEKDISQKNLISIFLSVNVITKMHSKLMCMHKGSLKLSFKARNEFLMVGNL